MSKGKNLGAIDGDAALRDLAQNFPSAKPTPQPARQVAAKNQEPEHPLTVRIPTYVAKEIRRAHAETGKSHRIIVLEALKRWGIPVKDEDLIERRIRPS
jgi:hypothetical protein